MLINLRTIHKPETFEEATALLKQHGVVAIYGGGAAVIRYMAEESGSEIEAAVDLSVLVGSTVEEQDIRLLIAAGATLQTIMESDDQLGPIIRAEFPETLRNTLTLGDLLAECNPQSVTLGVLFGFDAEVLPLEGPAVHLEHWYLVPPSVRLRTGVRAVHYAHNRFTVAVEKVSRTPADEPIVAAVALAYHVPHTPPVQCVMLGLAEHPVHYYSGMKSRIGNYKGSEEYRSEMAAVLSERAINKATALVS